jgi:hypothetical protein
MVANAIVIRGFLTQEETAYAAGFFDGEGHTRMTYFMTNTGPATSLRVLIGQKSLPVLEWHKMCYGGTICYSAKKGFWTWNLSGNRAEAFLERIRLHLKVKVDQVDETLSMWYSRRRQTW